EAHQLEDVATQYFGFSVSTYRLDELARDTERFAKSGAVARHEDVDEIAKAVDRLRDRARTFFNDLAAAHRGNGRIKSEERVRATVESLGATSHSAAHLTGALDILESTLALLDNVRLKPDATPTGADSTASRSDDGLPDAKNDAVALARRAGT